MDLGELILFKIVSDIFGGKKEDAARRPASIQVPPHNGHNGHNGHALPPAPQPQQPAAQPAPQPTFPSNVVAPPPAPSPEQPALGFKKAIEVWHVKPELAAAGMLAGVGAGQIGAITLAQVEASFPVGWQGLKVATAQEAIIAKSLLAQWHDGGVIFMGPGTLQGRRAYRMTKHPLTQAAPQPQPVPHPSQQAQPPPAPTQPTQPASVVVPPPAPPPGFDPISLPPDVVRPEPHEPAAPVAPSAQIAIVRPGEGLAQVAKHLGFPESAESAKALRAANSPQGPDAQWQAVDLSKGGLKQVGRQKPGLQPGDRLFVPAAWGPIDPARL
jgi:hypothetical protein